MGVLPVAYHLHQTVLLSEVSKQGKKRMIIIPTRFHERVDNELKDNDLTVEINLTFEEDEE